MEHSNKPTAAHIIQDTTSTTTPRKEPYVAPRVTVYGNVTALTGGGGGATFDGGATNDGLL